MARRRKHEEEGHHEAWAIPYGDLITLLLAFFVVMYAMSSVNEGKYRILSDSLVAAFRGAPKSLQPIQVGQLSKSKHELQTRPERTLVPLEVDQPALALLDQEPQLKHLQEAGFTAKELDTAAALIDKIEKAMREALKDLIDEDLVRIRRDRYWMEIEINTEVLFPSGSADLSNHAQPIVRRLGTILAHTPLRIYVEGHTDEKPISTQIYPSNWELSAARAARVVRLFATAGTEPQQMTVVGLGKYHPVADNDTVEGRRRNRRVVIVLMADRARMHQAQPLGGLTAASEPPTAPVVPNVNP